MRGKVAKMLRREAADRAKKDPQGYYQFLKRVWNGFTEVEKNKITD